MLATGPSPWGRACWGEGGRQGGGERDREIERQRTGGKEDVEASLHETNHVTGEILFPHRLWL